MSLDWSNERVDCAESAFGSDATPIHLLPDSLSWLCRALDMIDFGILLVQTGCRIAFINQSARIELADSHPLQLHGTRLQARHAADSGPLLDAIDGATRKGLQRLLKLGQHDRHPRSIAVLPVGEREGVEHRGAIVVLEKRSVWGNLSAEAFARQHRLTAAELDVLRLLCAGHEASEIAQLRRVELSTVRTQIATLRDKTGASSIGELVRQMARLPPLIERFPAAA